MRMAELRTVIKFEIGVEVRLPLPDLQAAVFSDNLYHVRLVVGFPHWFPPVCLDVCRLRLHLHTSASSCWIWAVWIAAAQQVRPNRVLMLQRSRYLHFVHRGGHHFRPSHTRIFQKRCRTLRGTGNGSGTYFRNVHVVLHGQRQHKVVPVVAPELRAQPNPPESPCIHVEC
jgi:hypothetical protein